MANQNVVVSDAITAAVAAPSIFPAAAQKPPAVPGTYISISQKKLVQNLDINSAARINAWVDSMRALSPTHIKSHSLSDHRNMQLPSAMDMFEQIMNDAKGKRIVMFLDYDGTLSPIVEDANQAFMSNAMRETVRKVARYFPTAIVSGRGLDQVYSFVRLAELYYAGSHGMDIKGPSKSSKHTKGGEAVLYQPASQYLPMMDEVYKALLEVTKDTPGSTVDNNKFCLSVHFRRVDEKKWVELATKVGSVMEAYPDLVLTQGRKVFEIRPPSKWNKGKALEFLLESLGYANCADVYPIYIGDDRTDEDAFKVLRERGQGSGILVSKIPKDTNASYSLQEPSEVMAFLRRLVDWKRLSLRKQFMLKARLQGMKMPMPIEN